MPSVRVQNAECDKFLTETWGRKKFEEKLFVGTLERWKTLTYPPVMKILSASCSPRTGTVPRPVFGCMWSSLICLLFVKHCSLQRDTDDEPPSHCCWCCCSGRFESLEEWTSIQMNKFVTTFATHPVCRGLSGKSLTCNCVQVYHRKLPAWFNQRCCESEEHFD